MGYKPFKLMFGYNLPAVCDTWLGWEGHNDNYLQSKCTWVNDKHELILAANRHALRHIKQSAKITAFYVGGSALR